MKQKQKRKQLCVRIFIHRPRTPFGAPFCAIVINAFAARSHKRLLNYKLKQKSGAMETDALATFERKAVRARNETNGCAGDGDGSRQLRSARSQKDAFFRQNGNCNYKYDRLQRGYCFASSRSISFLAAHLRQRRRHRHTLTHGRLRGMWKTSQMKSMINRERNLRLMKNCATFTQKLKCLFFRISRRNSRGNGNENCLFYF